MLTSIANAATVRFNISPRETDVGVPVTITIEIENAQSYDRPVFPEIPGAKIDATPGESRSSFTQFVNGRVTQTETVKMTYRLTPTQVGTITVPAININADGQVFTSPTTDIVVTKSESGDLLFAELQADRPHVYLGESLRMTLRIWIKPYHDRQLDVRVGADDLWGLIEFDKSSLGDFGQTIAKKRTPFGQWQMNAQEVLRDDGSGNQRAYYLYEIPALAWPQSAGTIAVEAPTIVMQYPVKLVRRNDFFNTGLQISQARPLSVTASMPPIEVKAPPLNGQPATFNGAVGQFDISVSAKPTDVAVGDPITLTLTIIDRTPNGGARLDVLAPPPLDRVPELNEAFKIPTDPLAGAVNGSVKTFTQTIRPKSDQVNRIPSIPLTYFDPIAEKYITRTSAAIPITVKPASLLAMNDVIQSQGAAAAPSGNTDLKEMAGGILANFNDVDAMLAQQQFVLGTTEKAAILAPPVLFAAVSVAGLVIRKRNGESNVTRRRNARKRALAQLHGTPTTAANEKAQQVAAAVCDYVANRLDRPTGTLMREDVVALLRQRRANDADVREIDALLQECEQMLYAGGAGATSDQLADRARACIDRLERSRL